MGTTVLTTRLRVISINFDEFREILFSVHIITMNVVKVKDAVFDMTTSTAGGSNFEKTEIGVTTGTTFTFR